MDEQIKNDWDHTEQVVSFGIAKLAKELGFPQYILKMEWYNKNGELTDKPFGTDIKAPAQSILQKWLRETIFIHTMIVPKLPNLWSYELHWCDPKKVTYDIHIDEGFFRKFEEALDEALLHAMCLYKNKSKSEIL